MDPARQLAQLLKRVGELCSRASARSWRARVGLPSKLASTMRSWRASATRRCWAPSWRLRSSRRRSASPASTIRAREPASFVVGVGVGQGLSDELGRSRTAAAPSRGAQALRARRRGHEHAPQPAAHEERSGHRGSGSRGARRRARECSGRVGVVVVDALRGCRCGRPGRRPSRAVEGPATRRAACPSARRSRPAADHRRVPVGARSAARWHSGHPGGVRPPRSPARRRSSGRGLAGHEGGDAAQRRLLVGQGARVADSLATRRCSASRDWGDVAQIVETTPSGRPAASRTGAELTQTQAGVWSGLREAYRGERGLRDGRWSAPRRPGGGPPGRAGSFGVHRQADDVLRPPAAQSAAGRGPMICSAAALQSVMTPASVADDEALGHGLHHRPQSLLVGSQRLVGSSALGGHRGEHERGQRRGGQEQLASRGGCR